MDTIPEDTKSVVGLLGASTKSVVGTLDASPNAIDGILARLSEIERRLDEKVDDDLTKKVAHMEASLPRIDKERLSQIPFLEKEVSCLSTLLKQGIIPLLEQEIARLSTHLKHGMVLITQTTDKVENDVASSLERLLNDLTNLTNRVYKLENPQPDASLSGKAVIDKASPTSGSFVSVVSKILHSANMTSPDNAGAIRETSDVSDDGVSINSADDRFVPKAKMEDKTSPQEQLAPIGDDKAFGSFSIPEEGIQDIGGKLKIIVAAVERQVIGADGMPKQSGSMPSCATSNRTQVATSSLPLASPRPDVTKRSIRPTSTGRLGFTTGDPLKAIPVGIPTSSRCGCSFGFPTVGVDLPVSLNAAGYGTCRAPGMPRPLLTRSASLPVWVRDLHAVKHHLCREAFTTQPGTGLTPCPSI